MWSACQVLCFSINPWGNCWHTLPRGCLSWQHSSAGGHMQPCPAGM